MVGENPSSSDCCGSDCDDDDARLTPADVDGDGFTSCNGDCNDFSFHTYHGAAERSAPTTCMTDVDGDGYGAKVPAEGATMGTDCDDKMSSPSLVLRNLSPHQCV